MICRVGSVSVRIQTFPPRRLYAAHQTLVLIRSAHGVISFVLSVSYDMTCVSDTNFPATQAVRCRPDFDVNKKKKRSGLFCLFLFVSNDMPKKTDFSAGLRGSGIILMRIGPDPVSAFRTNADPDLGSSFPKYCGSAILLQCF
jgi:hypothetical protein